MLPTNDISLEVADCTAAAILKRETQTAHHEAESAGFMHDLLNPQLELSSYISVLQRLYAILAPIERRLTASPRLACFPSAQPRILLAGLERDLVYFGALEEAVQSAQQRAASTSAVALETLGATAGVLYVIEGAAYGGKILCRIVAKRLGVTEDTGLRYFTLQAQTGVTRVTQLKHELNRQLQGHELETAIHFAKETFRSFAE